MLTEQILRFDMQPFLPEPIGVLPLSITSGPADAYSDPPLETYDEWVGYNTILTSVDMSGSALYAGDAIALSHTIVQLPKTINKGLMTVMMWIKPSKLSGYQTLMVILENNCINYFPNFYVLFQDFHQQYNETMSQGSLALSDGKLSMKLHSTNYVPRSYGDLGN